MPRQRRFQTQTGLTVRSDFERQVAEDLDWTNVPYRYEAYHFPWRQYLPSIKCSHCNRDGVAYKQRWYTPDFSLSPTFHVECKGRFTADDRATILGAAEANPEHTFVLLFQSDGWLTRKHSSRYSTWCQRKGFDYAIGNEIPYGWIAHVHGWTDAFGWDSDE